MKNSSFGDTLGAARWDMIRLKARRQTPKMLKRYVSQNGALPTNLHLGCGTRKVDGWLNCDISGSDINIDLACGDLPFPNSVFEAVCSQHVIEHLRIRTELEPLLLELSRCIKPGGEIWLSCPDIYKVCKNYMHDKGASMVSDRYGRWPNSEALDYPDSMVVNWIFFQDGQHKNLLDADLLSFILIKAGFTNIRLTSEKEFLDRFPAFPSRNDDFISLYMMAEKASG
ncbi:methyltransferase domain-containing protein [Mesorhizobium sp. M1403]|uniref:methyltransferase domain-containing protein n=1 Tax=Mesorhizobium sp. M1403 TaxID=2957097 RepID=UPI0033394DC6